ncbi:MAG TPA: EamA family transporter [Opitutaceae bacterium]|nr:EamA family transporter [Opitutaceae bacterium]
MLAALLTTGFFAATAVFARRAALALGATAANCWRLALAAVLLGAWSLFFGHGFGAAFGWFFASGLVGFGLGGLLLFQALPRAGANLANLTVQCGAAVVALAAEWVWLGVPVPTAKLVCCAAILGGVVLGLAPRSFPQFAPRALLLGAALAACSAVGQGVGQVLSRKAFAVLRAEGVKADPGTVTFERVLAGLLVAVVALAVARWWHRASAADTEVGGECGLRNADCGMADGDPDRITGAGGTGCPIGDRQSEVDNADSSGPALGTPHSAFRNAWPWVLLNTLTGPVLGVTCLQWALSQPQWPAGVTQSIVATAPLLTAPLAWKLGEDLPRGRYFAGALLAVAGTVSLFWPWWR